MATTMIDDYLASVPDDKRAALKRLRAQIRAVAPEATEVISYGRPAFRLGERYFMGFSSTTRSCSFYAGRAPVQVCADDLASYRTWKGTINFEPGRPLPDELVARLVQVRLAEFQAHDSDKETLR
jgi:uncharacterized protein YdhG (YjbR/CyaY superfamily)